MLREAFSLTGYGPGTGGPRASGSSNRHEKKQQKNVEKIDKEQYTQKDISQLENDVSDCDTPYSEGIAESERIENGSITTTISSITISSRPHTCIQMLATRPKVDSSIVNSSIIELPEVTHTNVHRLFCLAKSEIEQMRMYAVARYMSECQGLEVNWEAISAHCASNMSKREHHRLDQDRITSTQQPPD